MEFTVIKSNIKRYPIGDACLCWSFSREISREISQFVLLVFQYLNRPEWKGSLLIRDIVPSYNALAVHFDPVAVSLAHLISTVEHVIDQVRSLEETSEFKLRTSPIHSIPVLYEGEDLERISSINNLTIKEIISLHQQPEYMVAMIGFLPNFPYLIGLDPILETPRLESPRTKVPAGAVAIGGAQTGIYPQESPGGWNIIGLTNPEPLKSIEPGDRLKFYGVTVL